MHSVCPARWALPLAIATALAVISTTSAAGAEPPDTNGGPPLVLDHARRGEDAITALGAQLSDVAAHNDLTGPELAALLRADQTAWLDASGRLFFVEPVAGVVESPIASGTAPFPDNQTFLLHSFPGSDRVIYLDFDGHQVTGTGWNVDYGASLNVEPYSIDEDLQTFSPAEREEIQQIWQRVAEDFAPFRVDVTTEEPLLGALTRSDAGDPTYGSRVVVTSTNTVYSKCLCGGVAYVGTFDALNDEDFYEPAFVFTKGVGTGDKNVAEAVSHEAAHNLGLLHDGTRTQGYYEGQGSWAPIMGVGYYKPITQWSRGEYSNANNTEDDFFVMQNHGAGLRSDDHADTPADATAIDPAAIDVAGLISTRADVDVFRLDVETAGRLSVAASPAQRGPNLDIRLELLDPAGKVTSADPVSGTTVVDGEDVATGLDASLGIPVAPGTYFLRVDGVGAGSPRTTGYSDYASVGAYKLTGALETTPVTALHVSSIGMTTRTISRKTNAVATVSVVDAGGAPQSGATVTVSWSGSVTGTTTGVTGSDGSVALASPSTSAKRATFTVTVTSIERAGSVYDPARNVETTDTIST